MTRWYGCLSILESCIHFPAFDTLTVACPQAIAIASVYAAAKIVELSGSGVPGFPEDPFPDYDRGNSAVLIKSAMKWLHRRHASKQSNGKVYPHVQVYPQVIKATENQVLYGYA